MSEPAEDSVQRWTAKRRATLIISILKGETSIPEAARKHGITVAQVEEWHQRFLLGAENVLRSRPKVCRVSGSLRSPPVRSSSFWFFGFVALS